METEKDLLYVIAQLGRALRVAEAQIIGLTAERDKLAAQLEQADGPPDSGDQPAGLRPDATPA